MLTILLFVTWASVAQAARPFLNKPNTGFQGFLGPNFPAGELPSLDDIWCLNDFDYAARNFLNGTAYSWIRHGVGGEYTYRYNIEVFPRVGFKPRVLRGLSNLFQSMSTSILGYNLSAPSFISPAAAPGAVGGYVPEYRELGFIQAANNTGILYIPALYAEMTREEMTQAKANSSQVTFQQVFAENNRSYNQDVLSRAKNAGSRAIVWTIDNPADGNRIRTSRYGSPPSEETMPFTWEFYRELRNMASLPIILKGITSAAVARRAVNEGAAGIILSNHGDRNLDGCPSALQTALCIHHEDPAIFSQTEVLADGGIKYGTDVLRLLALGVKAVGLGRPFMYANLYGMPAVQKAIELLMSEIVLNGINLGLTDLNDLDMSYLDIRSLRSHQWEMW